MTAISNIFIFIFSFSRQNVIILQEISRTSSSSLPSYSLASFLPSHAPSSTARKPLGSVSILKRFVTLITFTFKTKWACWLKIKLPKITRKLLWLECGEERSGIKIPSKLTEGVVLPTLMKPARAEKRGRKTLQVGFHQGNSVILWTSLTGMFGGRLNSVRLRFFRNCRCISVKSGELSWL